MLFLYGIRSETELTRLHPAWINQDRDDIWLVFRLLVCLAKYKVRWSKTGLVTPDWMKNDHTHEHVQCSLRDRVSATL